MKTLLFVSLLGLSVSVSAGGGSSIGPANPAAQNCVALGGELEMFETPAGTGGNCIIDEWVLYRQMAERGLVKEHHYPNMGGLPNPAAVNCADIGGIIRIKEVPEGQQGMCVVEEWALFHVIDIVTGRR